jgi:RNA-directed DNA polymerase
MAFTSLNHYLDAEWLRYAYECTRKDGAVGVDGQTAQEYAANLEQNLQSLMDRLKSGRYRALPVRRHYIDKSDGGKRALGIPSFEEKVAQRAIALLLEPIYEQDFRNCSFGFRTGRNAHQALLEIRRGIMEQRGRWVLEVDVRKYFDQPSQCPPQEPTFLSKVSSLSLPALSFRSAASVAGLSGKRYNFVRASRASAMVPLWMRS